MVRSALFALVVACGDGPGAPTASRKEPTLETFADRMCACADGRCADQVVRDMARWSRTSKAAPRADAKQLMQRFNGCMADAVNGR